MAMYVYSTGGDPVGFVMETFIHDMSGRPIGHILGTRVHRLDGTYVGEWWKDMVVSRPEGRPRSIPPVRSIPPRRVPPPAGFSRRVVLNNGYADVFHLLASDQQDDEGYDLAAE